MAGERKSFTKIPDPDNPQTWESNGDISEASMLETPNGKRGVSVRIGRNT